MDMAKKFLLLMCMILLIGSVMPLVSSAWDNNLNDKLKVYFDFDGSGTSVSNKVNFTLLSNGTLQGGAYYTTSGKIGNGSIFDGSDDTMNVTWDLGTWDVGANTDYPEFTLGAWVKMATDNNLDNPQLFARNPSASYMDYISDDKNTFRWAKSGASSYTTTDLTDGNWHYITAMVKNGRGLNYVDGVLEGNVSWTSTAETGTNGYYVMFMSSNIGSGSRNLKGTLDEVSWWKRALSQDEINQLYNLGTGITYKAPSYLNWTTNLDTNLVAGWRLNETTGTKAVDVLNANNGTTSGSPTWVTGKISNALNGDGVSQYLNIGSSLNDIGKSEERSSSFWFKTSTDQSDGKIIGYVNSGTAGYWQIALESAGVIRATLKSDDNKRLGGYVTFNYNDSQWHHYVVTQDGSANSIKIYIDGNSYPVTYDAQETPTTFSTGFVRDVYVLAQSYSSISGYTNGTIDELYMWKRILNDTEVQYLYDWGKGMTYKEVYYEAPSGETDAPLISIAYPTATTYYANISTMNYNYYDANPDSCWYSINNGVTNSTPVSAGTNFTGISNGEGSNTWWLYCNDTYGNQNSTSVTFTVDTIPPAINIVYPTNTTYYTNISIINYSYNDTNPASCWYSINNGVTNSTPVSAGTNFTGISNGEGSNTWWLYCNDTYGNQNSTSVTFTVDTIPPLVNIIYPTNTTYYTNISILDYTTDGVNCWYSLDGGVTNNSVSCGTNLTDLTSNEGANTWIVWANDTGGNEGFDSVTFTFDIPCGTPENPCTISSWTELNDTRNNLTLYYKLTANLSSSDLDYDGIGNAWVSFPTFTGEFDGDGNTISDLIGTSGLFTTISGNVSNLGLVNINITSTGGSFGGFGNSLQTNKRITNCYITGRITAGDYYVGGFVGDNYGTISSSYSNVQLYNHPYGNIGGIAGTQHSSGIINNSYVFGSVEGGDDVGGMVGNYDGNIYNSFVTGSIKSSDTIGGIIGQYNGGSVTNSYYDSDVTGLHDTGNGEPKTTAEMKTISTFAGWDINYGITKLNSGYPYLYWQIENNSPIWFISELTITYPQNLSYNYMVSDLNYSYNGDAGDSCWYSADSGVTNSTPVSAGTNFVGVISVIGENNWIVYCNDTSGNEVSDNVSFYIYQIINLDLIYPTTNVNVTQNQFFNVILNASCSQGDCGDINISLDPLAECDAEAGICTETCAGIFTPATSGWFFVEGYGCTDGVTNYWWTNNDAYCDTLLPEGTGDCTEYYNEYDLVCPSYERNGNISVTSSDCVDAMDNFYGDFNDYFDFTNGYFTGINVIEKGLINTTEGAIPFYTNESNPRTINLNDGQSELITFWVNATGNIGDIYLFFANASMVTNPIVTNTTPDWYVTIQSGEAPPEEVTINVLPVDAVTLNGGTTKDVNVLFETSSANVDSGTAQVVLTNGAVERTSSGCTNVSTTFNCTITFNFYDEAGVWNINASILDNSANLITNTTETATINALDYVTQDVNYFAWSGALTLGVDNQEASNVITLTNGGNQDYATLNIKGQNATGVVYSNVLTTDKFSIDNITASTSGIHLEDNTDVDMSSILNLNSHGASVSTNIYSYVDVPLGIKADNYLSSTAWGITLL